MGSVVTSRVFGGCGVCGDISGVPLSISGLSSFLTWYYSFIFFLRNNFVFHWFCSVVLLFPVQVTNSAGHHREILRKIMVGATEGIPKEGDSWVGATLLTLFLGQKKVGGLRGTFCLIDASAACWLFLPT